MVKVKLVLADKTYAGYITAGGEGYSLEWSKIKTITKVSD